MLSRATPKKALGIAFLGAVLFRTWLQTWRYDSFHANAYDLSYLDQPIWATNHISFLYSSLSVNNTYLGEHFSPILGVVLIILQAL